MRNIRESCSEKYSEKNNESLELTIWVFDLFLDAKIGINQEQFRIILVIIEFWTSEFELLSLLQISVYLKFNTSQRIWQRLDFFETYCSSNPPTIKTSSPLMIARWYWRLLWSLSNWCQPDLKHRSSCFEPKI